ncbi:MAG: branched-chain amino acid ABC transporter permease [Myxococcaceae bacterium]|nr:branched-chain amino acid ABC transporter permease [Myxococcaceae bacterium]MCI0671372.1 branched-chain amino acid ABC transporter permease [Myxococcaceae bacterium]
MTTLLQLTVSGLALGVIYALVALGFVAIYRASRVFNFAHGELLTSGAFLMASATEAGVPWVTALGLSLVATGLLAACVERVVLRPLVGRPVFVTIILTLFVGQLLRALVIVAWGAEPRGLPTPWDTTATVEVLGARVLVNSLVAAGAGAVALAAYFLLIRFSRLGVAMRAASQDQEVALALGIPVGRVLGATWAVAGMLAALAGIFLSLFPRSVDANLGFIALRAFPAVIVGGLDSAVGTVLAGLLLGLLEVLAQGYVNEALGPFGHNFHTVFPYVVMMGFLALRPHGLLGTREVQRV